MQLTPNFKFEELVRTDKEEFKKLNFEKGLAFVENLKELANIGEIIRSFYNIKYEDKFKKDNLLATVFFESAFRCPELNGNTSGSVKNSVHTYGSAGDTKIRVIDKNTRALKYTIPSMELFTDLFNKTIPLNYEKIGQVIIESTNMKEYTWVHIGIASTEFIKNRKNEMRPWTGIEYKALKSRDPFSYKTIEKLSDIPKL